MDFGVFLPVSGAACTRAGLTHAAETAERLGFTHGVGGRPDHHPVEDRVRLRVQLVGVVHRPAGEAVPGVDDRAGVPRRRDRAGQARRQRAGDHLPRPGPLGQGRRDDRLAVGGPVHPRRRDRLDGARSSTRSAARSSSSSAPRVADGAARGSRATCSPRSTARSRASTTRYEDIAFYPKAHDEPIPIWCGGESRGAQRRAGSLRRRLVPVLPAGHPGGAASALRQRPPTPREDAGRDPDEIDAQLLPVGRGHR